MAAGEPEQRLALGRRERVAGRVLEVGDDVGELGLRTPGEQPLDGRDVDPSYADPTDYTPRCRLYRTNDGLQGLPYRRWIGDALRASTNFAHG